MKWGVIISPIAEKLLEEVGDTRLRANIIKRINGLAQDPGKQGKALRDELAGYRSVRAASHRYRILYRIDGEQVIAFVVALGIRKEGDKRDIYALAKRLKRAGLLE